MTGALSLCEVPDSLLMWAHYGISHTGFVLEFDPSHPYFTTRRSEGDEFGHLRRVVYRDTRPSVNLIDLDGVEMFLVKSKEWEYEHEWRVLRTLKIRRENHNRQRSTNSSISVAARSDQVRHIWLQGVAQPDRSSPRTSLRKQRDLAHSNAEVYSKRVPFCARHSAVRHLTFSLKPTAIPLRGLSAGQLKRYTPLESFAA